MTNDWDWLNNSSEVAHFLATFIKKALISVSYDMYTCSLGKKSEKPFLSEIVK